MKATIKIEQAADNPYYMTYRVLANDTGKQVSSTQRVHKAEDPTDAQKIITRQAQAKGYTVFNDPKYTPGY